MSSESLTVSTGIEATASLAGGLEQAAPQAELAVVAGSAGHMALKASLEPISDNVGALDPTTEKSVVAEAEPVTTPRLEQLSDDEFMAASREFGEMYKAVLSGTGAETDPMPLSPDVAKIMDGYHAATEGLSEPERAKLLITGYRRALNEYAEELGEEKVYAEAEPTEEALKGVIAVERGPYGLDILRVDGKHNEELFGHDGLSFSNTGLMLRRGLPPLVVVYDYPKNPVQRQQVTAHETSHAVWAMLRQSGAIPASQEVSSENSAFETARDEAVAQLAAGQNGFVHGNAIKRMSAEGYEEPVIDRYREAGQRFNKHTVAGTGVEVSDAILGITMARNFEEMLSAIERLSAMAEARSNTSTAAQPSEAPDLPLAA